LAQGALPNRGGEDGNGEHVGAGDPVRGRASRHAHSLGAPSQSRRKRSDVTIELGRGRRVRVDSDIDPEALGHILDVVLEQR